MTDKSNNRKTLIDIIILMAGEGKRMYPLTKDRPKGLLPCKDGATIFSHLIKTFKNKSNEVNFIPVLGHGRDKVCEEIAFIGNDADFNWVSNPFYASAGPLVSLWLGLLKAQSNKIVIVNGDTLLHHNCIKKVFEWMYDDKSEVKMPKFGLCVSNTDSYGKDDMKVLLDDYNNFVAVGKNINLNCNIVKSAGILCLKDNFSKNTFLKEIDNLITNNDYIDKKYFWHNVLNELKGIFKIEFIFVNNDSWFEVDTNCDLEIIN